VAWVDVVGSTDFEKTTVTIVALVAEAEVITGPAGVVKPTAELGVTIPSRSAMEKAVRVYDVLGVMVETVRVALLAEAHATLDTEPLDRA
jgi:hypothetical protein